MNQKHHPRQDESEIKEGKIKFFDTAKGFGFIKPTEGPDVFLHIGTCKKFNVTLPESAKEVDGLQVRFRETKSDRGKGMQASWVELV